MPLITIQDLKSYSAKRIHPVQIARCAKCSSENVSRKAGRHENEGPTDMCENCGHSWPHKPGTITAQQHIDRTAAEIDAGPVMMSRTGKELK